MDGEESRKVVGGTLDLKIRSRMQCRRGILKHRGVKVWKVWELKFICYC